MSVPSHHVFIVVKTASSLTVIMMNDRLTTLFGFQNVFVSTFGIHNSTWNLF